MTVSPRNCERVVLIGWGAIGTAVARLLAEVQSEARIVAVAVRDPARPRSTLPDGARLISRPAELSDVDADLVIEAAGRDSVAPWARAALGAGVDFVVSSTSALAEAALLDELCGLARTNRAQLIVQPGALGGVDALAAARHMGLARVEHRIVKPAHAWAGTEAESLCALNALDAPVAFFTGTAAEAAARFPQNANVALTTALAGIGPERTRITLIADPAATLNRHEITASGDFGTLDVQIANRPLPENPKSSAMTALNLVRLIGNRKAGLVV
ncbi:aspartate dehydrogenase [Rhizobium sp. PL01]|uniref:aspartate dehydrogenase n=1 Tax=Rhizobium sp. PL01 TaxID=3085631 RepID=UPI00298123DA|nr:aspartate dehydrogenase [Rhizobium sp. PL01]MDW5318366.1 aspartate dehydrogenase [Rhizobium sp. PL01]